MEKYSQEQLDDLQYLMGRIAEFENKPSLSRSEQRQSDLLLAQISLVKSGASLHEMRKQQFGVIESRTMTAEQRKIVAGFRKFVMESRVSETGVPTEPIAVLNGNFASFVPTQFYYDIFDAQKLVDPMLSEDDVSYLETMKGGPVGIPTLGDTENDAAIVGENNTSTAPDLSKPYSAIVNNFTFRTGVFPVSIEAFQDVAVLGGVVQAFGRFAAERMARGVAKKLVNGSGTGEPLGLLTALAALGIDPVIATGSGSNTGNGDSATDTIGSADLANLIGAVDPIYRKSGKCAFLMNPDTYLAISAIVTKNGEPLIRHVGAQPYILDFPVKQSPAMPTLAASANTVIFGDLSYWVTRCVTGGARVKVYREAPGLVEYGLIGLQYFGRYDGALCFNDTSSPSPLSVLQQHS